MRASACCVAWMLATAGLVFPHPRVKAAEPPPLSPKPGVVFVVGGVGGLDFVGWAAQWMLPRYGVPHEVRDFVWTHGYGKLFKDLQDIRYLRQKAEQLAMRVRQVKEQDPQRPVYLIGKSGGAGLVLAAAEQLPPATLERIVLLSAAVSSTYDLRPALRATRGQIVSFYSDYDWFILGWGTKQFGTVDRVYGPSAGLVGFVLPANLMPEEQSLYRRLEQVPWKPGMMLDGHFGQHLGTSMPLFVGRQVAPWLKP